MSRFRPRILAIETSGYEGSIALSTGETTIEERSLATEGRRHAQTLVSETDRLLRDHSVAPSEIDAVAVSIGPGSFTGLRVGVVFAKTFCWANDAKLIAVDTLQALAQQIYAGEPRVTVISDAQRNELFINEYEWDSENACRRPCGEIRIESLDELQQSLSDSEFVTGPGLQKHAGVLTQICRLSDARYWLPKAGSVLKIGQISYVEEEFSDMYLLEPLYIRRSYAEEKAAGQ